MACLETTFIIDLIKGKSDVRDLKDELDRAETLFVAAPSIMEIWAGALMFKPKDIEKIDSFLSAVEILSFDEKSAKEAGEIYAELSKKGLMIQPEDIMIAGIARSRGEKVVTRDNHFTHISGLKVLKY